MVWHGRGWGRERSSPLSSSFWVVVSRYALATLAISVAPTPHVEDRIWLRSVDFAPCFIYFFIIIISLDCNPCVSLYSGITPPPPFHPSPHIVPSWDKDERQWKVAGCCVLRGGGWLKVESQCVLWNLNGTCLFIASNANFAWRWRHRNWSE